MGVATMKKSETARFLVKSDYAFGKMGCPPRIPPDATSMIVYIIISSFSLVYFMDIHSPF